MSWSGCLLAAVVLTACAEAAPEPPQPTGGTTGSATGSSDAAAASVSGSASAGATGSTDVRDVAVEVYRAMWADWVEAGRTADYDSPALREHAASQALQLLSGGLRSAHDDGVVLRGEPVLSPQAVSVSPRDEPVAVSIVDCLDSTNWREYSADGQLRDEEGSGGKHRAKATVGLIDGSWKVTRLEVGGLGTCT